MLESLAMICVYITMFMLFFGAVFAVIYFTVGIDQFCKWIDSICDWLDNL